jgi:flagellar basal-body rod modification protein FlgD
MKMSGIEMNSIAGAGSAAAARVASALAPKDAKAAAGTANGTTSSTPAGTITSSDFMTLLVTELKNQDPTQPTDPNAYIQQLVGVNSLQQLISINQDLAPIANPAPTTGS